MLTPDNCIRLCETCPNRKYEGTSEFDPVTGDLETREPRYINANLEFLGSDPTQTPGVPVQEMGVAFVDTDGNKTSLFVAGVQLEDIATCKEPAIAERYGFLWRKKVFECGAQVVKLTQIRQRAERLRKRR